GLTSFGAKDRPWYDDWGIIAFRVIARVPSGVDERQLTVRVDAAMRIAMDARAARTPAGAPAASRILRAIPAPILTSHRPEQVSRTEAIAAALAGLALLLFIIAVANVGNLLLGRALDRRRELAVRVALGMGRMRLVGQALIESLLLATIATLAALTLSAWVGG